MTLHGPLNEEHFSEYLEATDRYVNAVEALHDLAGKNHPLFLVHLERVKVLRTEVENALSILKKNGN